MKYLVIIAMVLMVGCSSYDYDSIVVETKRKVESSHTKTQYIVGVYFYKSTSPEAYHTFRVSKRYFEQCEIGDNILDLKEESR